MAEAGAGRERKESRAKSLREKIGKGEGETLRFGGIEERAVIVDKEIPERELRGETVAGNGIVNALLCAHLPDLSRFVRVLLFRVGLFLLSSSLFFFSFDNIFFSEALLSFSLFPFTFFMYREIKR